MVLENSSDSTGGDAFDENPPASDDDPYASSTPQAGPSNYRIDIANLPKPVPIIGRLMGYNDQLFLKVLQARIETHTKVLKRPPYQEEVEAISYWTAKQISIYSYSAPVGALAGAWRAYTTTATFRFPFWQPNLEKFNPQSFPSPRLSMIRGNNAVMLWHLLRYTTYGGVGRVVSQILFGSYSMTVTAVGELGDPRLKAMGEAMRKQGQQKSGGLPGPKMPGTTGSAQSDGMGRGAPPVDDASPTGGIFPEENGTLSSSGYGGDIGNTSDDPRPPQQPKRWPQQPKPAPAPMQRAEPQDQPFDPFDDASPTGGQGAAADTSAPQPQRQQGSAWDRVRQGAGRGSAGKKTESGQPQESRGWAGVREQAQSPTASDDYAFSKETEERSLARDQAQKEFDARVERERRGGDFSSGSGDQKRW